ncbi:MAG: ABC transporter ATP-binding protein [Candidatus Sulfotelmatobacter sp.]
MEVTEKSLVQIRSLKVTYPTSGGARFAAVDDVSLEIHRCEVIGILGESGCGKSTLANAILRLLPAHARQESGDIILSGRDLSKASEPELRLARGRELSLIPQDPALSLNPVMNVGSQIAEVLRAHFPSRAKERRARVVDLLVEVGFDRPEDIYGAYPHQLSGGQRQRIAISQAIACRPAVVIADEPTSKLDAPLQAEIVALLSQIRKNHGTAILLITHDPALLAGFADRIAIMYAGRIVESGVTADIFRWPLHPYTQALVRLAKSATGAPLRKSFPAIEGESPDPTTFPAGCRFEPRCPDRMEICQQRYPQVFLPEPSRPVNCFKYGE